MLALRLTATGQPPALTQIPVPTPGPGQVALRIHAAGLNFADLLMIEGRYQDMPPVPFTMGLEAAGIVTALGPSVTGPAPGTRVAVCDGAGALAEYGTFTASRCIPLPDDMPFDQAAGFQIAYGTSHLALTRRARLQRGETLLVLGAAGGVGLTAVEVGAALGARVIAVARGEEKLAIARAAGATHTLDASGDIKAQVRALGGADVVYDPVGGDLFAAALGACRPEARVLVIGFASGTVPPIAANHLLVKNIDVMGFYWGGYRRFASDALDASLRDLLSWYAQGRLKPHVSHSLPLSDWAQGLDLLRTRRATGKVVITL
jgi:NADPH2:quinone reductase